MSKFITIHKPYEREERHTFYTRFIIDWDNLKPAKINVDYIMYYDNDGINLNNNKNSFIPTKESEKEIEELIKVAQDDWSRKIKKAT